jgi:hypothetical protein
MRLDQFTAIPVAFLFVCLGTLVMASPSASDTSGVVCSQRSALAHALSTDPGLDWATLRQACSAEIDRAQAADPIGHAWFHNAANGFAGTPLVLMRLLPALAPEIWGPSSENFARFGLFGDPEKPVGALPRGVGVAGTEGRPYDAAGNLAGEIDYSTPQLLVVTLACGSCHTGQVALEDGSRLTLSGAPSFQFDVRKWRAAFIATRNAYMSPAQIGTQKNTQPAA